jgi:S-adenosylmethionine-dependent methyltransferase
MERSLPRAGRPHVQVRTAVVWAVLRGVLDAAHDRLAVLDVGGGTGGFAVPIAHAGHLVTVVDASPDALAALTRRAAEAGVADRVRALQGDGDALGDLVPPASIDLVLCHSLLEVVDEPGIVVKALTATLRPGAVASVLVANRAAAVLGRAIGGHLETAVALLDDPDGSAGQRDRVRRRYDAASAAALLTAAGLTVEQIHGVRVIADLLPGSVLDGPCEDLLAFETAASARFPYRDIATQLHLLARKPA